MTVEWREPPNEEESKDEPTPYAGISRWGLMSPAEAYAWKTSGSTIDSAFREDGNLPGYIRAKQKFKIATDLRFDPFRPTVERYLLALEGLRKVAPHDQMSSRLWALMRDADLFEIPSELITEAWQFAAAQVDLAQQQFLESRGLSHNPKRFNEENDKLWKSSQEFDRLSLFGLPEKLPFKKFMILPDVPKEGRYGYGNFPPVSSFSLGWFFCRGEVWELDLITSLGKDGLPNGVYIEPFKNRSVCNAGGGISWDGNPEDAEELDGQLRWNSPEIGIQVALVIWWINDHRRYISDRRPAGYQKKFKGNHVAFPTVPPPYYTVLMRDDFVSSFKKKARRVISRQIDWKHRWSVRGHEAVYVRRGNNPVDEEEKAKLLDREYSVYSSIAEVPEEDLKRLEERGYTITNKEWVAVKTIWRQPMMKPKRPGSEHLPYIPSKRKSARKRQHDVILRLIEEEQ